MTEVPDSNDVRTWFRAAECVPPSTRAGWGLKSVGATPDRLQYDYDSPCGWYHTGRFDAVNYTVEFWKHIV